MCWEKPNHQNSLTYRKKSRRIQLNVLQTYRYRHILRVLISQKEISPAESFQGQTIKHSH
jgi:hypothetical protein